MWILDLELSFECSPKSRDGDGAGQKALSARSGVVRNYDFVYGDDDAYCATHPPSTAHVLFVIYPLVSITQTCANNKTNKTKQNLNHYALPTPFSSSKY